jgi:hypothetical protein
MQWIKLADRQPPTDGKYLVFAENAAGEAFVHVAWWQDGWSLLPDVWCRAISHWMPLPRPPAELEALAKVLGSLPDEVVSVIVKINPSVSPKDSR